MNCSFIRYADFLRICGVQAPSDFHGFRVEADGLYTILPGWDVPLTEEERATLSWHPTGHYDKPALPLPCNMAELRIFVSGAGLAGCINEVAMAELIEVSDSAPAPNSVTDPARRLSLLRDQGGNAKWSRNGWKFPGIAALVKVEKDAGRKRRDEKTIRADLKEAADAERETEREAKRALPFDGLTRP